LKAAVIYNPSSGKGRGAAVAKNTRRLLGEQGLEVDLYPTTGPCHATELARELTQQETPRIDVIVAMGGDGTINEVVTGMLEAREAGLPTSATPVDRPPDAALRPHCRLGIIPLGTVNVVARELKLPFRTKDACTVIAGGRSVELDIGKINDRRFVLMTGAGIDAVTIQNIDLRAKRWFRSLAFASAGLTKGLAHRHPQFLVKVEGDTHRATFFVAGNFRYYAAHLTMTPTADPFDGLLDILLFNGTTKRSFLAFWASLVVRRHVHGNSVTCLRTRRAELKPFEGSDPVWLQADGEIVGQLPATVEIEPAAIEVLVP